MVDRHGGARVAADHTGESFDLIRVRGEHHRRAGREHVGERPVVDPFHGVVDAEPTYGKRSDAGDADAVGECCDRFERIDRVEVDRRDAHEALRALRCGVERVAVVERVRADRLHDDGPLHALAVQRCDQRLGRRGGLPPRTGAVAGRGVTRTIRRDHVRVTVDQHAVHANGRCAVPTDAGGARPCPVAATSTRARR